ncbi:hypothetical protein FOXG_14641 [Fusarium oxysporum f. sp. lycopersici 4287]|uniref:Uncharacterized protein n=2 Tax=Fusarium oxysporum TaxID=5507 RepID=A0A0J9W0A9_FUSO4|nr:hypothetical protein FOXG_14641 [Fusarium oxysporum f. sp. lycopersici 4287]KAJ9415031.1 hypothetical protein QL093DRAFT_1087084 [Fusarium oxysporum]KNB16190.1 hypothetical protein FOXG_14641 [Fusarium oxysporum f. sp. lycopersici 4287]
MVESTNAERLDYLWEMALAIHGGIIEHLDEDHELDKPLIAHLKEIDHFIMVKKGLQSRRIDQASDNDNQLAGGTTPPRSHQSPLTIGHVNNQSISPPSHRSAASLPFLVLLLNRSTLERRRQHDEKSLVGSQENLEIPKLCARCDAQYPMQAGLTIPSERRGADDRTVRGRGEYYIDFWCRKRIGNVKG